MSTPTWKIQVSLSHPIELHRCKPPSGKFKWRFRERLRSPGVVDNRFGEAVDRLRRERGWTLDSLGERLGVSGAAVGNWIAGKNQPEPARVFELERVFECGPGDLSRLLGYLPLDYDRLPETERAISSDARLNEEGRRLVLEVLQLALSNPAARPGRRRGR